MVASHIPYMGQVPEQLICGGHDVEHHSAVGLRSATRTYMFPHGPWTGTFAVVGTAGEAPNLVYDATSAEISNMRLRCIARCEELLKSVSISSERRGSIRTLEDSVVQVKWYIISMLYILSILGEVML